MRFGYPRAAARHKRAYLMKENSFVNRRLAENVVNRDLLCAVASGFLVKVRAGQKPLWGATFHAGSLI
ncbi:MAG: hypothetical protein WBN86_10490, partial [Porticoccaceae bacterium]